MLVYFRYAVVGAIVGLSAVLLREIIALALPSDTPTFYALSVAIVYLFGILASFAGHKRVTFSHIDPQEYSSARALATFTLIALFGLLCTTGLSLLVRYYLPVIAHLGKFDGAVSFIVATLLTSIITFVLNARLTFTVKN
tara:strand:+ start:1932 stop:2351 length:420 start_codon:yes stop_codon:yes gene_type:complete